MTYYEELGQVLKTLDTTKYKEFIAKYKEIYNPRLLKFMDKYDEERLYGVMCLMIVNRVDMPDDIVKTAKEHLDKKGWAYE